MAGYFAAVRHWNPAQVGSILAAQKLASVIAQASAGWFIDETKRKKWLTAAVVVVISLGSAFVVWSPGIPTQMLNQIAVGAATAMATLLIAALSLGIVGRNELGKRIGRNGAFSHAGNMLTASVAGYVGFRFGQQWIFYLSALTGIGCTASALALRSADIDDSVAREAPEQTAGGAVSIVQLLSQRTVLLFATTMVLFHLSNSALLPLAIQEIARSHATYASLYATACIVLPQLVMIPVSLLSGAGAGRFGRKPVFLLGFGALVLRGLLFAFSSHPNIIVAIEALDGIGTAIASVVTVLIVADLARNTGRFNALGGLMQSALGVGAFLGNLLAGVAAKRLGFAPVFFMLAVIASAGLLLFWFAVPETRPERARLET